jgi:hypothetical protein
MMNTSTNHAGRLTSNTGGVGPVRIRSNPSLSSEVIIHKPIGTPVTVLESTTEPDPDGFVWHQVRFDLSHIGWVRDDVITIFPSLVLPEQNSPPDANPSLDDTLLFFETNSRQVRVFNEGAGIFMNVFNKITKVTEVSRGAATKLPADVSFMETYLTIRADRSYLAEFRRLGETQLRITQSATGQDIQLIESGFGARGTVYQAN